VTRPADPPTPALEPAVREALAARAEPDGFVPLDRFLAVALYGEGVGYYRRARSPFGPSGDFYTAPRVHPLFARTLARRLAAVRAALDDPPRFTIVDLGAGDGTLLAGLLVALRDRGPADGIEAVAVERSPERAAEAVAAGAAVGGTVQSARSLAELGPVVGAVLANELLDAQPARQLRWDGSDWHEVGVRLAADRLRPAERPVAPNTLPAGLPALDADRAGTVVEVSAAAEAIVREVADHLVQGELVLCDYGDEEPALLAGHAGGTLAAVRSHRPVDDPWQEPGATDLSTFVNFSRVRRVAARAGLVEVGFARQAEALGAWGFPEELARAVAAAGSAEEQVRVRLAAKSLLFGFETFRVLELAARASALRLGAPTST
jgi:SAM-dependent MidA family methyltransferase